MSSTRSANIKKKFVFSLMYTPNSCQGIVVLRVYTCFVVLTRMRSRVRNQLPPSHLLILLLSSHVFKNGYVHSASARNKAFVRNRREEGRRGWRLNTIMFIYKLTRTCYLQVTILQHLYIFLDKYNHTIFMYT